LETAFAYKSTGSKISSKTKYFLGIGLMIYLHRLYVNKLYSKRIKYSFLVIAGIKVMDC
jgi:hypothetical protein